MISKIKMFYQAVKVGWINEQKKREFRLNFELTTKTYTGREYKYPVYISSKFMDHNGLPYFEAYKVPMAIACAMDDECNTQVVVINEALAGMDELTIHTIILHEIGHLENGDVLKDINDIDDAAEMRADKYAQDNGGDIVHALTECHKVWKSKGYGELHQNTFDERMAAFTGKPVVQEESHWMRNSIIGVAVICVVGIVFASFKD